MSNGSKNRRGMSFVPPLSSQVALFPVSLPDEPYLERIGRGISVTITPRVEDEWVYGKTPRLLFAYIQTLIARESPDVDMDNQCVTIRGSFRDFCRKSGLPYNGASRTELERTLENLAGLTITVIRDSPNAEASGGFRRVRTSSTVARRVESRSVDDDTIARVWFNPPFWSELVKSSVPLDKSAMLRLGKSPRAFDIFTWLSYRTNGLSHPVRVTWEQLFTQFEATDMPRRKFREKFRTALDAVLRECPTFKVTVDKDGVVYYPREKAITDTGKRKEEGDE